MKTSVCHRSFLAFIKTAANLNCSWVRSTLQGSLQEILNFSPITAEMTTNTPSNLAKSMSSALPQYLTNLAHEPSVGLHYLATHAQARAAPTLANAIQQLDHRAGMMGTTLLDVRDATAVLSVHMPEANETLERVLHAVGSARAILHRSNSSSSSKP